MRSAVAIRGGRGRNTIHGAPSTAIQRLALQVEIQLQEILLESRQRVHYARRWTKKALRSHVSGGFAGRARRRWDDLQTRQCHGHGDEVRIDRERRGVEERGTG